MSDKKTMSVTLKEEFNDQQCMKAMEKIQKMDGVLNTHFLPQGCFGIDHHRLWVDYDSQHDISDKIIKMPEVKKVNPGHNFD